MKGRTGPPKTPTNLAQLRGFPGHQKRNKQEPKPAPASTVAPAWIAEDPIALEEWDARAEEYARLGHLSKLDTSSLAHACYWRARARHAYAKLKELGLTSVSRNNGEQASPWFGIALKADARADSYFARFGETPSDRTRLVAAEPEAPEDPMEALLRAREAKRSA